MVLCCCLAITPDLPSSTNGHVSDACSGCSTLETGLRQCSTGWHPSLSGLPSTVGAQCSGTTYLPYTSVWPHLWFVGDTVLAAYPWTCEHKVVVLTFKVLHSSTPRYLEPPLVTDLPGWRALRSAATSCLVVPPIKLSTVGSRAFPVAAAQVCNSLPEAVISSSPLQTFHCCLKLIFFDCHTLTWFLTVRLASLQWSL